MKVILSGNEIAKSFEEGIKGITIQSKSSIKSAVLQENEILITVKSASLNYFDLLMLVGKYQIKPPMPFVLLTEACGVVSAVGEKVSAVKCGDKVLFSTGSLGGGSEEIVMDADLVHVLPPHLSFSQGAAYLMMFKTAYCGLVKKGMVKKDEWLLITGASGGMGSAAIMLGKYLGARVIAAASSDEKCEACKKMGADFTVNYSNVKTMKEQVNEITGGDLCDVIYDVVGGEVFNECVRCVSSKGGARFLVVGFVQGIPTLSVNMVLIKQFSLIGVNVGAEMILDLQESNRIDKELVRMAADESKKKVRYLIPFIQKEYPMESVKEAFTAMMDRSVIGKIAITFNPDSFVDENHSKSKL